eukprot:comp12753_c0_seq1/m.7870 comp12753_c0_seq1/g.7870  ORF comp12753_c0_seq1/g.7870 comp12753_c0_seq1/m.7870 type:complete len:213 (-) comp12753_c0_seq1:714-1352(-)
MVCSMGSGICHANGHSLQRPAVQLLYQVVCAVEHLHRLGYAHRDLKPENVVLAHDTSVRLVDLGGAAHVDDVERCCGRSGTEHYLAPECLEAASRDPRQADSWSLGVLFWVLVWGRFPWQTACSRNDPEYAAWVSGRFGATNRAQWLGLSHRALELLRNLLRANPARRWSASQARQYMEAVWACVPYKPSSTPSLCLLHGQAPLTESLKLCT